MQDDLVLSESENTLTAFIACEVDHHTARRIRETIDERLFLCKPTELILDFLGVRFMDSSGVGLILGRSETAASIGAKLKIRSASPTLMKILRLSGIDRVENITII
jgi:stage II sporulation protein AA (anti-sigma F factor antagonist)